MQNKSEKKVEFLSASALSFVGDAVFSLLVRQHLCLKYDYKSGELTTRSARLVCAKFQSAVLSKIEPILTEEESELVKRCRNANTKSMAKNASPADYHRASGLEGLVGFLHLNNKTDRLNQIMDIVFEQNI